MASICVVLCMLWFPMIIDQDLQLESLTQSMSGYVFLILNFSNSYYDEKILITFVPPEEIQMYSPFYGVEKILEKNKLLSA